MSKSLRVIRQPRITEKSMHDAEHRREYAFDVDPRANKVEIRQAVEQLFGVKVERVNTSIKKGRPRRIGWKTVTTPDRKKAIVRLAEGEKIDLL